jgi:transcriptional regulator with XRE-family HTH domain
MNNAVLSQPEIQEFFHCAGKTITGLRTMRKLSINDLADILGIDAQLLMKAEEGEQWMEPAFYEVVAKHCQVTARIFLQCLPVNCPAILSAHKNMAIKYLTEKELYLIEHNTATLITHGGMLCINDNVSNRHLNALAHQ